MMDGRGGLVQQGGILGKSEGGSSGRLGLAELTCELLSSRPAPIDPSRGPPSRGAIPAMTGGFLFFTGLQTL